MAFAVSDFQDLLKLLDEHPEWQAELRRKILDDEFLRLPEYVRQNSADIRELTARTTELQATTAQLQANTARLQANTAELQANTARLDAAIARLTDEQAKTAELLRRNIIRTDTALGAALETRYRMHPGGHLGHLVRKAHAVDPDDLPLFSDADDDGRITEAEALAVRQLDLIVQGVQGRGSTQRDVLLAVEVSNVIDARDIGRVAARAATLRAVGYAYAIPVVVGAYINDDNRAVAKGLDVEVRIERLDTDPIPDM